MFLHIRLSVSWPVSPERRQMATWPKRHYALRLYFPPSVVSEDNNNNNNNNRVHRSF